MVSSNLESHALFTFKRGDVRVIITHKDQCIVGKVSSHAMSLVSPVWEKFIFDPRKASSTQTAASTTVNHESLEDDHGTPAAEIDFSEDDSEALLTLLHIAHLHFDKVRTAMNYEQLLKLAVLCNQYLCINIVKPWLRLWLEDEVTQSKLMGQENWLFIAWTFGRDSIFELVTMKLVKEGTTGEDGRLLNSAGDELPEPMPPGIVESILEVRNKTIGKLVNIIYSRIDKYEASDGNICAESARDRTIASACDAITYGSLTRGLQKVGLWPRKEIEDIHVSVQELASNLSSIIIHHYPESNRYGPHGGCCPGNIKQDVSSQLKNIPDPVLESHRRHMAAQNGGEN